METDLCFLHFAIPWLSQGGIFSFLYLETWNDMVSYFWYKYEKKKIILSMSNAKLTSY